MGGGVMDVSLVITIHDRIELYDLMKFYESKNVTPVVTMLGRGTATEKQLHLLGLEAMQKALEMDKETFLRLKKDEIIPFIEEEIAVRYYWQEAGIRVRLRYDDQLREALTKAPIQF